jgi:hypothetical protein
MDTQTDCCTDLDYALDIPCDFPQHSPHLPNHDSGPARYWMRFIHECNPPLENKVWAVCASFANDVVEKSSQHQLMSCEVCKDVGEMSSYLTIVGLVE